MQEVVGRVTVCFPSHVDALHCRLYDGRSIRDEIEQRERMQDLVVRLNQVVNGVAMEYRLPRVADKEESIVLKGDSGRKKKRGVVVGKVE